MLISHQHKFILLKNQKTAVTSLNFYYPHFFQNKASSHRFPEMGLALRRLINQVRARIACPLNRLAPFHADRPEDAWNLISKGKLNKNPYTRALKNTFKYAIQNVLQTGVFHNQ